MEAFLQNPTCTAHVQEWDGTSKLLALEAKEKVDRALYGKKMEKKEQEREEKQRD